jgi:hypothetical protein
VSGTGLIVGIIAGGGTMVRLVKTPGVVGRGIGTGISAIMPSDVGLSTLGIKAGIDVNWDWLELSTVDGRFLLQGRGMVGVGPLACRCWGDSWTRRSSAEARALLPELVGAEWARLDWLNFLNKREKDIDVEQQVLTKLIVALFIERTKADKDTF